MKKTIKISGVVSDVKKITLLENTGALKATGEEKQNKYKIWITRKDGMNTKAYQQFQKIRPLAGDAFDVEVDEKEASFVNAQGKTINYTDRTIKFFYTQDNTPEITPQAPQAPQSDFQAGYGVQPIQRETPHTHGDLTQEINKLKFATHALWAVLIQGDEEKETGYEFHKTPLVAKSTPTEEEIPVIGDDIGEQKL